MKPTKLIATVDLALACFISITSVLCVEIAAAVAKVAAAGQ